MFGNINVSLHRCKRDAASTSGGPNGHALFFKATCLRISISTQFAYIVYNHWILDMMDNKQYWTMLTWVIALLWEMNGSIDIKTVDYSDK